MHSNLAPVEVELDFDDCGESSTARNNVTAYASPVVRLVPALDISASSPSMNLQDCVDLDSSLAQCQTCTAKNENKSLLRPPKNSALSPKRADIVRQLDQTNKTLNELQEQKRALHLKCIVDNPDAISISTS